MWYFFHAGMVRFGILLKSQFIGVPEIPHEVKSQLISAMTKKYNLEKRGNEQRQGTETSPANSLIKIEEEIPGPSGNQTSTPKSLNHKV